jgi:hypothetical protein
MRILRAFADDGGGLFVRMVRDLGAGSMTTSSAISMEEQIILIYSPEEGL